MYVHKNASLVLYTAILGTLLTFCICLAFFSQYFVSRSTFSPHVILQTRQTSDVSKVNAEELYRQQHFLTLKTIHDATYRKIVVIASARNRDGFVGPSCGWEDGDCYFFLESNTSTQHSVALIRSFSDFVITPDTQASFVDQSTLEFTGGITDGLASVRYVARINLDTGETRITQKVNDAFVDEGDGYRLVTTTTYDGIDSQGISTSKKYKTSTH